MQRGEIGMTDAFIEAGDPANSKLQTYKNTVSGEEVHAEAVAKVNPLGAPDAYDAGAVGPTVPRVQLTDENLAALENVTVTGSVTANAGTNLNTSALALESGGNLAAAAASLSTIDDWDESDRAKVNPIVGQAGISANAGATDAKTTRTVTASDSPDIAVLAQILSAIQALVLAVAVPTTMQNDFIIGDHEQYPAREVIIVGNGMQIVVGNDSSLYQV